MKGDKNRSGLKTTIARALILFLLTVPSKYAIAQTVELEPLIHDFPDLNPKSIERFEHLAKKHKELQSQINDGKLKFNDLSEEDQEFLSSDEMLIESPFSTAPIGCSWYCAGGPSGIKSNSFLAALPEKGFDYKPENIHDFDLQTAWVEGEKDNREGVEISFDFELKAPLQVTEVVIYNGYCKDLKTWKNNSRVKKMELLVDDTSVAILNLQDTYKGQGFDIGSFGGKTSRPTVFRFRVLEVYTGDKYSDTAISEINFDGTGDH